MEFIKINNKRLGPLNFKQVKTIESVVQDFDDVNIIGNIIYLYSKSTVYKFKIEDLKILEMSSKDLLNKENLNHQKTKFILDVGASFGNFCIPNAQKNFNIIALEYDMQLFNYLVENINLNKKYKYIQPVLIDSDLLKNGADSKYIKNKRSKTTVLKVLEILNCIKFDVIRFDKRVSASVAENIIKSIDEKLLPKTVYIQNKVISN
tara:strand:+ start:21884 stop:22501 length:618 start_codon:yes stop_codon:yes gene_type:complete